MKNYDLYGIKLKDLEAAKILVENLLGIRLYAHESGYHCGEYYRLNDVGSEHFILQRNYDSFEDEWTEPEHQDIAILLYVNETNRSQEIMKKLTQRKGIELLQHQELEL